MTAKTSTRPLTPLMVATLQTAAPRRGREDVLEISAATAGATAKGLRERGLITLDGALTDSGLQVHAKANPAPAEEPATEDAAYELQERDMIRLAGPVSPQGYLDALAAKGQAEALEAGVARAEEELAAEAATTETWSERGEWRDRWHGQTTTQRRKARKVQRAARRHNRK